MGEKREDVVKVSCPHCGGLGSFSGFTGPDTEYVDEECGHCNGSGWTAREQKERDGG